MSTMVPGIKAKHAIVTPACREGRGVEGAVDEALRRLRDEYVACQTVGNASASFHFVLTVDRQ